MPDLSAPRHKHHPANSESKIKHHPDDWSTTSEHHHHVERAVQPAVVELVKWSTHVLPPDSSSTVFDDACGIGSVTAEVKKHFPEIHVLAIDSAPGMLEVFNQKVKKHGYKNVTSRLLDGGNLTDVASDSITHAFACTFIDLAHNASACIRELYRILAPGGVLALNTWVDPYHPSIGYPWAQACQVAHPGYKSPMVTSPEWSTPEKIKDNLTKAGFKDVQTKQITTHWRWKSPEEMTSWFFDSGNPVLIRWHDALIDESGGNLEDFREPFHQEVIKEYREEGGHLLKDEKVNLTIARK